MVEVPSYLERIVDNGPNNPEQVKLELMMVMAMTLEQIRKQMQTEHEHKIKMGWYIQ